MKEDPRYIRVKEGAELAGIQLHYPVIAHKEFVVAIEYETEESFVTSNGIFINKNQAEEIFKGAGNGFNRQ